jgi:hypothetical protein
MRLILLATIAALALGAPINRVEEFDAAAFVAMRNSLKRVPGVDAPPSSLWVVRFSMPSDAAKANASESAQSFNLAAAEVPAEIARFADFVVTSLDEVAIVNTFGLSTLPVIRSFHTSVARPLVPRGNPMSARVISFPPSFTGSISDVKSIVQYAYDSVPSNYNDPVTDALYPSAVVVSNEAEVLSRVLSTTSHFKSVSAPSDLVASRSSEVVHALVLVKDLRGRAENTLKFVAAAMSAGASGRGRGGTTVFVGDANGFPEWAPDTETQATVVPIRVSGSQIDSLKAAMRTKTETLQELVSTIHGCRNGLEEEAAFVDFKRTQVANAQVGATRLTGPFSPTRSPLRRLDTTQQFAKHVGELKSGVAVVFILRESDKFFSKHLKVARAVAENAATDTRAEMGDKPASVLFEVFMVDGEIHKQVANELRVPQVPCVAFLVELRDKPGVKGLRFFKAKDIEKAADIIKFMRRELFDGRDLTVIEPSKITFSDHASQPNPDVTLRVEYFDTNPRRFDSDAPHQHIPEYTRLLQNTIKRESVFSNASPQTAKSETPDQKAKREAKETKAREKEEAKKAQLKTELEAREEAKRQRIEEKRRQEELAAEQRKRDADDRAKEAQERKLREEADGTASKRRAMAKAKKARQARLAKLKKAKLAAKEVKDRAGMVRLWEDDSKEAAGIYVVGHGENLHLLDRIL